MCNKLTLNAKGNLKKNFFGQKNIFYDLPLIILLKVNSLPAKGFTIALYRSNAIRAIVAMETVPKSAPQNP